ncbi:MAG: hypothetical protein P9M15_00130 [Candidatus Electryoneaceae bacterium]|nr:hypothetical protein [Candidatus Electryoneaceae bacterium]
MTKRYKSLLFPLIALVIVMILLIGCASNKYMLDEPVNDPIMSTDDQQDSDLCKVEDGGYSGSAGECPT